MDFTPRSSRRRLQWFLNSRQDTHHAPLPRGSLPLPISRKTEHWTPLFVKASRKFLCFGSMSEKGQEVVPFLPLHSIQTGASSRFSDPLPKTYSVLYSCRS